MEAKPTNTVFDDIEHIDDSWPPKVKAMAFAEKQKYGHPLTDEEELYLSEKIQLETGTELDLATIKGRTIVDGEWLTAENDPNYALIKKNGYFDVRTYQRPLFDDSETTRKLIESMPTVDPLFIEERKMREGIWLIDDSCPYRSQLVENKLGIPIKVSYENGSGTLKDPSTMAIWSQNAEMMLFGNSEKQRYEIVPTAIFMISSDKKLSLAKKTERIADWILSNQNTVCAKWILEVKDQERMMLYKLHGESFAKYFSAKSLALGDDYTPSREYVRQFMSKKGPLYDEYKAAWFKSGHFGPPKLLYFIPQGIPNI